MKRLLALLSLLALTLGLCLTTLGGLPTAAYADESPADLAGSAAQAFDQGDFATAAARYEAMLKDGHTNGHVYYNLGVTYDRLGQRGKAVAAFLAARTYLPRDPDVNADLRFELAGIHDKLDAELPRSLWGRAFAWLDTLTAKEIGWATALLFGALGLAQTAAQLVPRLAFLRRPALIALLIPVVGSGLFAAKYSESGGGIRWGAVSVASANVYSGPGPKNPVVFQLQEGAPVHVDATIAGGYAQIELSDGKKGWIPDTDVKVY